MAELIMLKIFAGLAGMVSIWLDLRPKKENRMPIRSSRRLMSVNAMHGAILDGQSGRYNYCWVFICCGW